MKDGAALLQFEGRRVFTEELGDRVAQSLQLLKSGPQIDQLGLGPLKRNEKHFFFKFQEEEFRLSTD